MPELARPGGARIHYEVRGDGPLVVFVLGFAATPATYEGLAADLARDHRVVTWDPRGCGMSSGEGPYDVGTDAGDLLALIQELGPPANVWAVGHGVVVTIRAAVLDGHAIGAIVSPGIVVALRDHLEGTEGFASSPQVLEMLVKQLRSDPRASARATIESLNPQMSDDEVRQRVDDTLAYTPADTILARVESWLAEPSPLEELRAIAARAAVVWHEGDPWQAGAVERLRELVPEARLVQVEDGPLSRPDLAAAVVREMT